MPHVSRSHTSRLKSNGFGYYLEGAFPTMALLIVPRRKKKLCGGSPPDRQLFLVKFTYKNIWAALIFEYTNAVTVVD